ncbi:MAG TPA: AraC family transcriptional regulator [Candidatus Krumholzibacteria bacterium]|nr:AraC family transcriptional regulator [Candidatus Krumholzibacteria bacterium]
MSGDTLSDLLRAVRLRGALFFYVEGAHPWVAETPNQQEVIPAILPGVDHMMEFHGVARGSCWAAIAGETPVRLDEGDLVIFPQGDAHVMSSAPGLRAKNVDPGVFFTPRPPQLPFALNMNDEGDMTALLDGGGRDKTTIVCGFLGCDARPFNPLLAALPRIIQMRGLAQESSWVGTFLRSVVEESNRKRPGGEAVLERMSEMLFVEVLRRYVDSMPADATGWLAGMRDASVGRALAVMHDRPAHAWTIERLGEQVGLSRSSLHERFVHFIGQPPMQYLAAWRMQLAAASLRDTDAKVIEVALHVGYENEAAFSRAFRRAVGESPAAWRRERRARAARPARIAP